MASRLTAKHLFALLALHTGATVGIERVTVEHLKRQGYLTEREGRCIVTLAGKTLIQEAVKCSGPSDTAARSDDAGTSPASATCSTAA